MPSVHWPVALAGAAAAVFAAALLAVSDFVAFAADSRRWFEGSRFVKAARPDQQGLFRIKGLPPGEYSVVALDYVEEGACNEPEYLEPLRARAKTVTLTTNEPQTIAVEIAAAP